MSEERKRVPIVEGVFRETDRGPRLIASRCRECGMVFFPRASMCRNPSCLGPTEERELGPRGRLWSYTVQYFQPPPPARFNQPFQPYGVGMVDLEEGVRIVAMLTEADPEVLRPGMEVELVIAPLYHEADGTEVVTWKFQPLAAPTTGR